MSRGGAPDAHHGYLMRYVNPVDGGWAMPTISTMMRLIPKGFETRPYRSTAGTIHVVVEGKGTICAGNEQFDVEAHDVTTVPGWVPHRFKAEEDLVVFTYSDRVAQEKLGLFREQTL